MKSVVETQVLQAIVDYLDTRPHKEVRHLLDALLASAKPHEDSEAPASEGIVPEDHSG